MGAVTNVDAQRRHNFRSTASDGAAHTENSLATVDLRSFRDNLMQIIQANKERWKELAVEGMIYQEEIFMDYFLRPPLILFLNFPQPVKIIVFMYFISCLFG